MCRMQPVLWLQAPGHACLHRCAAWVPLPDAGRPRMPTRAHCSCRCTAWSHAAQWRRRSGASRSSRAPCRAQAPAQAPPSATSASRCGSAGNALGPGTVLRHQRRHCPPLVQLAPAAKGVRGLAFTSWLQCGPFWDPASLWWRPQQQTPAQGPAAAAGRWRLPSMELPMPGQSR